MYTLIRMRIYTDIYIYRYLATIAAQISIFEMTAVTALQCAY